VEARTPPRYAAFFPSARHQLLPIALEQVGITQLREAIAYCESVRDFITRDLFAHILEDEEEQVDFIETQLGLIDRIGLENYIQLQSGSAD
jgi:bacterioferritin